MSHRRSLLDLAIIGVNNPQPTDWYIQTTPTAARTRIVTIVTLVFMYWLSVSDFRAV